MTTTIEHLDKPGSFQRSLFKRRSVYANIAPQYGGNIDEASFAAGKDAGLSSPLFIGRWEATRRSNATGHSSCLCRLILRQHVRTHGMVLG